MSFGRFVLLLVTALRSLPSVSQVARGSLGGVVITDRGVPVANALVSFNSTNPCQSPGPGGGCENPYPYTVRSGADGRFVVAGLPAGQYVNICAEPPEPTLIASCAWPETPQVGAPAVTLAEGQQVSDLRLTLRTGVQLRFEIEDAGQFIEKGAIFHLLVFDSARRAVEAVQIGHGSLAVFATAVPAGTTTQIYLVTPLLMYSSTGQPLPISAASLSVAVGSVPTTVRLKAVAGIVNAASYWPSLPMGGGIASIFASGITSVSGVVTAQQVPLPTQLAGTSITVGGVPVPLLAVANANGQEQINFQVPDFDGGEVIVNNNGRLQTFYSFKYVIPGIFTNGQQPAVQHASSYALVSPQNPARRGELISIYATGLGTTTVSIPLGEAAPASPLAKCNMTPAVSIAGRSARVLFCGRAPGFVGLDQLNVEVPTETPSGAAELTITQNGVRSNTAFLSVE